MMITTSKSSPHLTQVHYYKVQRAILAVKGLSVKTFNYLEMEGFITKQPNGLYDYTPEAVRLLNSFGQNLVD